MSRIVIICFFLASINCIYSYQPFYTVTAPKWYRPNSPYHVVVTVHSAPQPVDVIATLKFSKDNDELTSKDTVKSGETKILEFKIENMNPQWIDLTVNGSGGITFHKATRVSVNSRPYSVFVQTDKGIYQPGQTVYFRVIATKPVFLPHNPHGVLVFVNDPLGNRIKQWSNVTFNHGVYSTNFQLSEEVNLGVWSIHVEAEENNFPILQSVPITVNEYVLPKFEVIVHVPPFITHNDSDMAAFVHARYTHGKPVKGLLTLNVTYEKWSWADTDKKYALYSTPIDGKAEIQLNPVKDLQLPEWYKYGRKIKFTATVVELLTGLEMKGESELRIYNSKYRLNIDTLQPFKPGILYTTYLTVSFQDDTPVIDSENEVTVEYSFDWDGSWRETSFPIKNGKVKIEVLPPETVSTIRFKARFLNEEYTNSVSKMQSLSERYLHISTSAKHPQVGDDIELLVASTKKLEYSLVFQIIGRGKILHTESIPGSQTTTQTISFKLSKEMAPEIRTVVYYTTSCGELVADALYIAVEGLFKTPVALSINPNSTKPGSSIEISVKTNPEAFVALSAVDQSVLLLKKGNDLTVQQLLSSLRKYEIGSGFCPYDSFSSSSSYSFRPCHLMATSTFQIFEDAGLHLLTNGLLIPTAGSIYHASFDTEYDAVNFRGGVEEEPRLRSYFPESFLWIEELASKDGTINIKAKAPDTITSFVINAFAVDDETGIGLLDHTSKLKVFRPFFVTMNLPYSVVRGETLALQAIVFNYLKEDVEAIVTLESPEDEFSFVDLDNEILPSSDKKIIDVSKKLKVKAGDGASTYFYIVPKKIGYLDLKMTATSTLAVDAVLKTLIVKAEGKPVYINKAVVADLRKQSTFDEIVNIKFPDDFVPDSERIVISAISDILGTTVNNLHKLLRMPYGCGEQNMLNFVPNIVIVDYLSEINKLTPKIKAEAIRYMESGYQRQLTYKRYDGSFSSFGNYDSSGSTWLTAFVIKSFVQAKKYITIDEATISRSVSWLLDMYKPGYFPERGTVFYKAMQGGSSFGFGLTTYVLSALLEAQTSGIHLRDERLNKTLHDGLKIVENNLKNATLLFTDYDLVFITYVLHLANSDVKDYAFTKMNERSRIIGDLKFWTMPLPEANESDPYSDYNRARSVDVEMTSYALLTYSLRDMIAEGVPIMKWLLSKRNENGGFESTQDTVVGIYALAQFAKKMSSDGKSEITVNFSYESGSNTMVLEESNSLILNKIQIPNNIRKVDISASGKGLCILQVSWSYNILNPKDRPAFEVSTEVNTEGNDLNIATCTTYIYEIGMESNMAVMEIGLPSGYVLDREHLPKVEPWTPYRRVEAKNGDNVIELYFDKIGSEVCANFTAYRKSKVSDLKPSMVEVYDYYEPGKHGVAFYTLPSAVTVCDLCETDQCKNECNSHR